MLSLVAAVTLLGTNLVMAQTSAEGGTTAEVLPPTNWLSIGFYVLLFVILCFFVGIVGKVFKVYDLTQQMQNKKPVNWNNVMGVCFVVFLVVGGYGAYWSLTEQGSMTLPEAASAHGVKIDNMFTVTSIITLIVFVITQALLFWFLFRYRHNSKRKAYYLPHNNTIEKVWTIIPAIVLTILVVFGFFTWQEITNVTDAKGESSINIDVTGRQFEWLFRYPGKDGVLGKKNYTLTTAANALGVDFKDKSSFDDLKADTLVVPVHKSIKLNIFAMDVIHSVFMPHFRVQMNAVPGLPTFFRFTPTITTDEMRNKLGDPKFEYLLYCNKICGSTHYNMQKVVRVVSESEYNAWIATQKPYLSDNLKKELKLADATPAQKDNSSKRLALNN